MKKLHHLLLIVSIISLCTTGCEYELSEDYYNDIDIEDPSVSLSLLNFQDGQEINDVTDINYAYSGNNVHKLYQIEIYIDDFLKVSNNADSGSFTIDPFDLSEGQHSITINYYFSSGSGSLADVYDLEAYKVTENFNFLINKSLADAFSVSNVKIEEGTINVYWEPIVDDNFDKAYLIIKYNNSYPKEILLDQATLLQGKYNDNQNTEGNLSYHIRVTNNFNVNESEPVFLEVQHPNPSYEIISENSLKIKWEQHPLYANFDYYLFSASYLNNNGAVQLDKNGGEYIVNIENELEFEYRYLGNFVLYRNNQGVSGLFMDIFWGEKFEKDRCKEYVYSKNTDSFFALEFIGEDYYQNPRTVVLHELDNNFMLIRSKELKTVYNGTGDLTLDPATNKLIVDLSYSAIVVDPYSLSVIESFESANYTNKTYNYNTKYRNGFLIIIDNVHNGEVEFYNAETKELFHVQNMSQFYISDDGTHFFYKENGYTAFNKIINFNISEVVSIPNYGSLFNVAFYESKNKVIINSYHNKPYILDLETKVTEEIVGDFQIDMTQISEIDIDQITNKVLFRAYEKVMILDLDSNQTYYINYDSYYNHSSGHKFRIFNNKFISSNGFYLDYFTI